MSTPADARYVPTRAELLALADRCEAGAATLVHEAEHPAEILTTRAGGDQADPQEWATRKHQAALVAQEYAADLRRLVAELGPHERVTAEQFAQAELVCRAAELGGILIDGRRAAESAVHSGHLFAGRAAIDAWRDGTHPAQIKADLVERTGLFAHVVETIDGIPQVPFWQLGGPRRPVGCTCACKHDAGCMTCACTCDPTDAAGAVCPCCGADDNAPPALA